MPAPETNYLEYLSKDPHLEKLLAGAEPRVLGRQANLAFFLYSTIVMQQLSTRVGEVFLQRFLNIYHGQEPTAEEVLATPMQTLRGIGLSNSKATYIKNVAQFDLEQGLGIEKLDAMTDDEVTAYITSIKGIGKWTAHVFLISALGREDVFPADDLILQKAVAGVYKLDRTDKKKFMADMLRISEKWRPYRTYASLHLWRWKGEEN
jgi:DNA-3-methyladenine glycosylase II